MRAASIDSVSGDVDMVLHRGVGYANADLEMPATSDSRDAVAEANAGLWSIGFQLLSSNEAQKAALRSVALLY